MKKIILTGDRPTGKLHIGHYVGSLKNRVMLQNKGDYDEFYVFIADNQALTDNVGNPEKLRDSIIEVALDYLSVGLDPNKVTIFIQSQVPEMAELSLFLADFVTVGTLKRNPTVKDEIKQKKMGESLNVGFFTYPISQAADILTFGATLIPVGADQAPMIEQTREIARRFNFLYGDTFVEPDILTPENEFSQRLPGTDGKAKMSKSLNNCIYLSDSSKEVHDKVFSMFTDPKHLKKDDPGHVKGNPVFIYLEAFATDEDFKEFLPEYKNLNEMKMHYQKGGLGDVTCKKFLYSVLEKQLTPIRERRKEYENNIPLVLDILKNGNEKARQKAHETMLKVKKALRIDYFDNDEFANEQIARFSKKD